jgi:hypothetical protein
MPLSVDQLISIYINKAGRVNSHFTVEFKKASDETKKAVLERIQLLGLKSYQTRPDKKREPSKIMLLRTLLKQVADDKEKARVWFETVKSAERYYRKQLEALENADRCSYRRKVEELNTGAAGPIQIAEHNNLVADSIESRLSH